MDEHRRLARDPFVAQEPARCTAVVQEDRRGRLERSQIGDEIRNDLGLLVNEAREDLAGMLERGVKLRHSKWMKTLDAAGVLLGGIAVPGA
jgi:hypothetical protein